MVSGITTNDHKFHQFLYSIVVEILKIYNFFIQIHKIILENMNYVVYFIVYCI